MNLGYQAFAARQWLARRPEAPSALFGTPAVEVRSAEDGRGLGLYAVRSIEAFSRLLSDMPLVLMQPGDDLPELYQHFNQLDRGARENYLSLSYQHNPARDALLKDKLLQRGFDKAELQEMATVASIMQTNAFNVDMHDGRGSRHRALFARIARINHSCAPNAHVCFYPASEAGQKGRMVIHALRAIHPDEEILISYFNILLPKPERHNKAQKWGFACLCPVCTLQDDTAEDERKACRDFIAQQAKLTNSTRTRLGDVNALLAKGNAIVTAASHKSELFPALPNILDGMGMLQATALLIQKREEQRDEAVSLLERAAIWEARITGPESPATATRLHKVYQFAAKRGHRSRPQMESNERGEYHVKWPV